MRSMNQLPGTARIFTAVLFLSLASPAARCQDAGNQTPQPREQTADDSLRNLQKQMLELKSMMEEMHDEIVRSHRETIELRQELEAARQELAGSAQTRVVGRAGEEAHAGASAQVTSSQSPEDAIKRLEEDQQLTAAKLDEIHQTKVESASKYPVRLSGMALLNLFSNKGVTDNLDFPNLALSGNPGNSNGAFGGTLRQSLLGLEVFGPDVKGAKVSADMQFDFAG